MTNGDSDVIGFSLFVDSTIRNLAKVSCALNSVEESISSSESGLSRLLFWGSIVLVFMSRWLCASPSLEPYQGTLCGNGSPVSSAKATYPSYSPCQFHSNSDHLRFTTNIYYFRCLKKKKEITSTGRPHHASSLPLLSNHRKTTKYKPVD